MIARRLWGCVAVGFLAMTAGGALRVPDEVMKLWPENPPGFLADAPPETTDEQGRVRNVTVPTLAVYLAPKETRNGTAIIICSGGGYGGHDWKTHVIYAADVFNQLGVSVFGLRYRTRPPHKLDNAGIQALTLLDAKRAVRQVRSRAKEWGIDPQRVGIAGYSAGANLAINLAANFDAGDPGAADPVQRLSSRPDFAVGCATWHWRQKRSPFVFQKNTPPVYLVHATNDGIKGGAPIELPRQIQRDLTALGVPVWMDEFDVGAHGVGNLIPQRVQHDFPPAKWPWRLLEWLDSIHEPGRKDLSRK
jgi:predicted esterase